MCDFLGNRFVYAVISQRAGGLLIGVDMNPDQKCNFECVYCYVDRSPARERRTFSLRAMSAELKELLQRHRQNRFKELSTFSNVPEDLLKLKGVALSGEGEPTLSPRFTEVVEEIIRIRSSGQWSEFKIVLITNGTGLNLPAVQKGLRLLGVTDEIWVKLDAGTYEKMRDINKSPVPLSAIIDNIVALGQWRPVIIQSLFCSLNEREPEDEDIDHYIQRLLEIRDQGADIREVQIYSVVRPPSHAGCGRLSLNQLSQIAKRVRSETGLNVEVY
jgi:wyosine [tRNA(Phe)-imidazoG37] synthetase (radical SAM superfamily)